MPITQLLLMITPYIIIAYYPKKEIDIGAIQLTDLSWISFVFVCPNFFLYVCVYSSMRFYHLNDLQNRNTELSCQH